MKAVDYKTRFGVPGGKVKVLPTGIPSSSSFPKSTSDKITTENGPRMHNGLSTVQQAQPPMFRLPPPPKKPSTPNKATNATNFSVTFNQIREPREEVGLSRPTGPSNGFVKPNHTPRAKPINSLPPIPQRNFASTQSLPTPKITPPSTTTLNDSGRFQTTTTKESEGMLPDMKKLQYELAQLRLELASITAPMKEHDEWLTLQSEQVKELFEQQKTLQTRIVSNGLQHAPRNETQNHLKTITITAPPAHANVKKSERVQNAHIQPAPTHSEKRESNVEKLPSSQNLSVQGEVSPVNCAESNKGKDKSQFDTSSVNVNVRRISGLFEQNASCNENLEKSKHNISKKQNSIRRTTGSSFALEKSLEFEDRRADESLSKSLNRSKSMYLHKPPPSPKPIYNSTTNNHANSFDSAREKIADFHSISQNQQIPERLEKSSQSASNKVKQQIPKESPSLNTPTIKSAISTRRLPQLPKRPEPKTTLPSVHSNVERGQTHQRSSDKEVGRSTEKLTLDSKDAVSSSRNASLGAFYGEGHTLRDVHPSQKSPSLPTKVKIEAHIENNSHVSPSTGSTDVYIPPPPPLPAQIESRDVKVPPPPPLPSPAMQNGYDSQFMHGQVIHEPQSERNSLSTPPFTPPGTFNMSSSKADLLQQIRDFGNSGKILKKASSVNSDGGTPQSPRKHVMHDALQTRFKAFCGNGSESSESEEDEDWED